jgi:outer membrane protein OmpA-like peptidoglycan-associated protein
MTANLLSLAQQALGGDFPKLASQFLGESSASTQTALTSLIPAVLGGIAQKGATTEGAASLMSLVNGANLNTGVLDNLGSLFGSGGTAANALMKLGTSSLVPALFGDKAGGIVSALSSNGGVKASSATNLLAMIVPLVLTFLKKFVGQNNLDSGSLATLLKGQGPHLSQALDSRLAGALGFASPAAFANSIGGAAADTAKRAAAAVASGAGSVAGATSTAVAQARSPFMRYLPWLIAAAVLLFLWNLFSGRSAPPPAPASAPAPTAAPAAPSWIAPTLASAKVYFDVGSSTIGADGQKTIAAMADLIKKESAKVGITGYTDRTGDAAKNEELAKNRAIAVRDALKAAGVAEASLELKAPAFVETGTGGNLAEARRVEINKL